jgi:hypothetical protein
MPVDYKCLRINLSISSTIKETLNYQENKASRGDSHNIQSSSLQDHKLRERERERITHGHNCSNGQIILVDNKRHGWCSLHQTSPKKLPSRNSEAVSSNNKKRTASTEAASPPPINYNALKSTSIYSKEAKESLIFQTRDMAYT